MRTILAFAIAMCSALLMQAQNLIYVNQAASGANNGSTWANAFTNLQDALDAAATGDEIWVAAGTYLPSKNLGGFPSIGRDATFYFHRDMTIRGGFVGTETSLSQRVCNSGAVTILSGDLGTVGNSNDNALHVCYSNALSNAFLMDCITITLGNGDTGSGSILDGAGWYNDAQAQISSPSFSNCTFSNCHAARGAGFYNNAQNGGEGNCLFTDCTFSGNLAEYGGGLYNHGSYGDASPNLFNCIFRQNRAGQGGGLFNNAENGQANGNLTDCFFSQNRAIFGGGMYNFANEGNILGIFLRCNFENNLASVSGGGVASMAQDGNAKGNFVECNFRQNQAGSSGGAAWNQAAAPWFHECKFAFNSSSRDGGAVYNDGSQGWSANPRFLLCDFDENVATGGGGAIFCNGIAGEAQGQALFCKFRKNRAAIGGAVAHDGSSGLCRPIYYNCIFSRNAASTAGGAAYLNANTGLCNPVFASCSFSANASPSGSLLMARQINGGSAIAAGYNIASHGHTGNVVLLGSGAQFNSVHGIYEAGATIACSGTCLPGLDPLYLNPSADDLDLQPGSPAIDQGNSFWVLPPFTSDLAGNPRVQGSAIDLGAYETPGPPPCPRVIYVNNIATGANDGTSWADAYLDLQDALAEARVNPCTDTILIAEGVYKPSQFNDRYAYFELVNDIEIYGGFPNTGNPWFPQRDLVAHETILSGDLGQPGVVTDNSYVVVSGKGTTQGSSGIQSFVLNSGTILHGVSIIGATDIGLLLWGDVGTNCELILDSCSFYGSGRGINGIAMAPGVNFTPKIRNCVFRDNIVGIDAPVLFESLFSTANVSPRFSSCLFKDNVGISTVTQSGGLCLRMVKDVVVENCEFDHNTSAATANIFGGGAVKLSNELALSQFLMDVKFLNCLFHENYCRKGGAVFCYSLDFQSAPIKNLLKANFINCTFMDNSSTNGSSIHSYNFGSRTEVNLQNCITWGNNAVGQGAAIYLGGFSMVNHQAYLSNTLVDGPNCNAANALFAMGTANINCLGGNIFNQNPQFVNAAGGNFRLSPGSPAINAGNNAFVLPSMATDIIGNVRIDNGTVDMGCYENFPGMMKQGESAESNELADDLESQPDFILAPNPAHDQVKLSISSGKVQGGAIFDLMGKQVQQWQGEAEMLDISALPAGVYLVRLQFEGSSVTKRLVKE